MPNVLAPKNELVWAFYSGKRYPPDFQLDISSARLRTMISRMTRLRVFVAAALKIVRIASTLRPLLSDHFSKICLGYP
jgi:hypothetical protein